MSAVINKSLVNSVKAQLANQALKMLDPDALALLLEAVDRFPMGPDAFVDIGRMPVSVVDLKTWIAFLGSVKKTIDDENAKGRSIQRDSNNQVIGAQAEYMVDGRLRSFKTGICILHGLTMYYVSLNGGLAGSTVKQVVESASVYCRMSGNRPENISPNGGKLWEKVYDPSNIRASNYLAMVVGWTLKPSDVKDDDDDNDVDDSANLAGKSKAEIKAIKRNAAQKARAAESQIQSAETGGADAESGGLKFDAAGNPL